MCNINQNLDWAAAIRNDPKKQQHISFIKSLPEYLPIMSNQLQLEHQVPPSSQDLEEVSLEQQNEVLPFCQNSVQVSQVQQQELDSMLTTLGKFKRIYKQGRLTTYLKQRPPVNRIFAEMSSFFHTKQKNSLASKKTSKQKLVQMRKQQFECSINKKPTRTGRHASIKPNGEVTQLNGEEAQLNEKDTVQPNSQNSSCHCSCHICWVKYTQIHPDYGYLCPTCAQFNLTKRNQVVDLSGLTALVTGGRIKIGFEVALKLLRDGARVYVTSRFANDTLMRYQRQEDYEVWKHRLQIVQCDFLSQQQVDQLVAYIKEQVPKLDILINNAAQTIVRPHQFYAREIQNQQLAIESQQDQQAVVIRTATGDPFPSVFANNIAIRPEEVSLDQLDEFGQPTDRRRTNSWVQSIEEVPLLDCYTTQVVNSVVPFHLISQLKCRMTGTKQDGTTSPSWVINVSSMEGIFYRNNKSNCHPHTNMAKAALNMITRTCAAEFRAEGIWMNSVDTGWVTNENPFHISEHMQSKHQFKCPLDCVDGAMRVLDPIYGGVSRGWFESGLFLKNYRASSW